MANAIMPQSNSYANAINAAIKGDEYHIEQDVSALVPVQESVWQDEQVQTVDLRRLHAFLEIKKDFTDWAKVQIERGKFKENRDFVVFPFKGENPSGGRPRMEYHVTVRTGQHIAMMSESDKGEVVRDYFIACEKRLKQRPQLPGDYLSALKALVVSEEAKQKAEALNRALEQQLETERPLANLARSITGDTTMFRREWVAMMKDESGINLAEKKVSQWLIDNKYCYRERVKNSNQLRAYAHHANLFKLEPVEVDNGPTVLTLKITGEGVLTLTPKILNHFNQAISNV